MKRLGKNSIDEIVQLFSDGAYISPKFARKGRKERTQEEQMDCFFQHQSSTFLKALLVFLNFGTTQSGPLVKKEGKFFWGGIFVVQQSLDLP